MSVRAERLSQSGRTLSEPSETPQSRITLQPVSIRQVTLHITLESLFHRFFSLCLLPILNKHSAVGANRDHKSEWVQWEPSCIWIVMRGVTL
jgi:hypothetical protein